MLTLKQLETFREVMRAGTTVGAAQAMCVSQPAVSNAIRQMEARIGFDLFDRRGNHLVPTPDAEEMYRDSEAIFSLWHAFAHRVENRRRSAAGTLRIVSTPPVANAPLPGVVRGFLAAHPDVRLTLDTRRIDGVLESVSIRTADIGFALNPPHRDGLRRERIATTQMVCCFPPGHPLSDRAAVLPADLESVPLVIYEPGSRLSVLLDGDFVTERMRANAVAEVRYSSLACQLAEAGLGVAVVDALTIGAGRRYRLDYRPLYPSHPVPVVAITREDENPIRVQASFLKYLRSAPELAEIEEFGIGP
ncbi:MAG: LysR family transcriptional regulator [Jannaschia sp.]